MTSGRAPPATGRHGIERYTEPGSNAAAPGQYPGRNPYGPGTIFEPSGLLWILDIA